MKSLKSLKFVITAPFLLVFLFVVDWMTPGVSWFKWAALGIGIAWFFALLDVVKMVVLLGGIAAFGAWLAQRRRGA